MAAEETLAELRELGQSLPRPLVLAHGVYDLLHPNHLRHLRFARDLGSSLLVAVWSDEEVTRRKGPSRPINNADFRARMVAGLKPVDHAFIVWGANEESSEDLMLPYLEAAQPDLYCVANKKTIFDGLEAVLLENGHSIQIVKDTKPDTEVHSTTGIIATISERQHAAVSGY